MFLAVGLVVAVEALCHAHGIATVCVDTQHIWMFKGMGAYYMYMCMVLTKNQGKEGLGACKVHVFLSLLAGNLIETIEITVACDFITVVSHNFKTISSSPHDPQGYVYVYNPSC